MKTLYIDCGMGAAGDMLTAALLELLPQQDVFLEQMNRLGLKGVQVKKELTAKCGINGTHMTVLIDGEEETSHDHEGEHHHDHEGEHHHDHEGEHHHDHEEEHHHDHEGEHHHDHGGNHHHSSMADIEQMIGQMQIPDVVKKDVLAVYALIAEAESHVHGVPVTEIHFHEVGTMDAIVDITAVCLLIHQLAPQQVIVSPIHVGAGHVHCAHGILPVPAPATAYLLQGIPVYGGSIKGELCTPTGAALLKHFATSFGEMPVMTTSAIGYGMGKKDFAVANCVRAFLGETKEAGQQILELNSNVDDMTAEEIGFAMEQLFDAGCVEVFTLPAGMKKCRPGTLIVALCPLEKRDNVVSAIFKYTTTIGVREKVCNRYVMDREITTSQTIFGEVHYKQSSGYGTGRKKPEYEDVARIARERGISLWEVTQQMKE